MNQPDHPWDAARARRGLGQMLRIRRFEEKCVELYQATKIRGFLHVYIGEEAVATGVIEQLQPADAVVATYREHGHALVRGVSAAAIMAEMYGKQEGCARGRGGSMHLFDRATRFYGGNAIVGGGLPLAVGLALADHLLQRPGVTACFFGEGASAEGEFHEALNLAGLWQLPVLFVCENNLYAMGTAIRHELAKQDVAPKAAAYGIAHATVDGMDLVAVDQVAREAVAHVRRGAPFLLECRTYRFRAHSMFDAELYRAKGEVETWKARDPLELFFAQMQAAGCLTAADREQLERDVAAEVAAAVEFAEAGTWEALQDLTRFVYAEGKPA